MKFRVILTRHDGVMIFVGDVTAIDIVTTTYNVKLLLSTETEEFSYSVNLYSLIEIKPQEES